MSSLANFLTGVSEDSRRRDRARVDAQTNAPGKTKMRFYSLARALDQAGETAASMFPRMDEGTPLAYDEAGNLVGGYDPAGQISKAVGWLMPSGSLAEAFDTGKGIARGVVKTFGGIGAKTADKAALSAAEALEQAGTPMAEVWKQTGWFRAPWDKKWRFEIDDSKSKGITAATLKRKDHREFFDEDGIPSEYRTKMSDALKHPVLYEVYPNIEKSRAYTMRSLYGGDADYTNGTYRFDPSLDADNMRSLALHEIQHGIQQREGFARGYVASPNTQADPFDMNYWHSAGEAEARAVQERMNLTPAQRRAKYPLEGNQIGGVRLADLIVRGLP